MGATIVFQVFDLRLIYPFVVLLSFISQVFLSAVVHHMVMWFRLDSINVIRDTKSYGV